MDGLATALALAILHIESRTSAHLIDNDVNALETILAEVHDATRSEQQALKQALLALGKGDMIEAFGLVSEQQ